MAWGLLKQLLIFQTMPAVSEYIEVIGHPEEAETDAVIIRHQHCTDVTKYVVCDAVLCEWEFFKSQWSGPDSALPF